MSHGGSPSASISARVGSSANGAVPDDPASRHRVSVGIFLVVTAVYVLTGPGRIDMIDGQPRYEVANSILAVGQPIIRDPALMGTGLPGLYGFRYSYYNAGASVASLPLVWLGGLVGDPQDEARRFFFSLTSAMFGGFLATTLFAFYVRLGVSHSQAIRWTGVSAFATLVWPLATSVFDQAQHAFLALLSVSLGHASAKRESPILAAAAGLSGGLLLNYQESFALLLPALALSTLSLSGHERDLRGSWTRFFIFLLAAGIGLFLWMKYNTVRFGTPFVLVERLPPEGHPAAAVFGSVGAGLLSLLFSPGKSIFLYSPPILLGLLGIRGLWHRERSLALTVVVAGLIQLMFVSSLRFFGSDWAWGPRYLVVTLPLWALAFPFVRAARLRPAVQTGIVVWGLVVQLLGISIDHQRFFFERALPDFFWASDPWCYFKNSALLARPTEIVVSLRDGVPATARWFAPSPYLDSVTYAISGNRRRHISPVWMRQFKVFYLPRPWPLWMLTLPPDRRPVNPLPLAVGTLGLGLLGAALIRSGLRAVEPADANRPGWVVKE
jgi:hypothetical protein